VYDAAREATISTTGTESMKLAPGFWQGAAAASSLLLAGGYVAYSAGILRLSTSEAPNERPEMFSSSKVRALVPAITEAAQTPTIDSPQMMPGSKSAVLVEPELFQIPAYVPPPIAPPTEISETTTGPSIMYGSKSPATGPLISPPRQEANTSKAMPEPIPQQPRK
jgi:hypothetical protein